MNKMILLGTYYAKPVASAQIVTRKFVAMVNYEDLKQELEGLGFDLKTDRIVRLTGDGNLKEYAVIEIPLDNDLRDIAYFDFGISPKVNSLAPLLDHLIVRVDRKHNFLDDHPIVLMQQAFRADWGPLPSKQCLIKRANDYLNPEIAEVKHFTTLEGRLNAEFEKLGFNYEKMMGFPSSGNGICLGQIMPMMHICGHDDLLISTFNISLNNDPKVYPINTMTTSLRRSTIERSTCLMREFHFGPLETLPTMSHVYNRAEEVLKVMKANEKFFINQEGRLIANDQTQANQKKRGI